MRSKTATIFLLSPWIRTIPIFRWKTVALFSFLPENSSALLLKRKLPFPQRLKQWKTVLFTDSILLKRWTCLSLRSQPSTTTHSETALRFLTSCFPKDLKPSAVTLSSNARRSAVSTCRIAINFRLSA